MKLVNSGDLAGGVIIDMGANTDEEYVVKVYATRDDIHRRVVIATQLFTNSENYTKDICEASAVHVFSFDVANSADNDDEPLNLIPALFYDDSGYPINVYVEYGIAKDVCEVWGAVMLRTGSIDAEDDICLISRNSYFFNSKANLCR